MPDGGELIPQKLRDAFDQAVSVYANWVPLLPERLVMIDDRFFTMSETCGLVDKFRDTLPISTFERLSRYLAEHSQLRDSSELARIQLELDRTYSSAGNCFRKLIESRKQ
jgi:hypothetical protein